MEQALERVKKAIAGAKPEQEGNHLKTLRSLLAGIVACREYIKENAQTDRGCAEKLVRELDAVLEEAPAFRKFAAGKKDVHKLHTRKLAEAHLEQIQEHLEALVKEEEEWKSRLMCEWVKDHPVFGELRRMATKRAPKNAYVLLFEEKNDELKLMTERAKDGRIFTRIRLPEFSNEIKVHKEYQRKTGVCGAAVIHEKELLAAIGKLPPATENKDQLHVLLNLSSRAAGQPAREFIELNAVLKALHDMARRRKFPKDAYVLLFQEGTEETPPASESSNEMQADATAPIDETEQSATEQAEESSVESVDETPTETIDEIPTETIDEAPTETIDEAPTETIDEAPTETIDEAPTENVDEAPTETIDEAPTENIDEQESAEHHGNGADSELSDEAASDLMGSVADDIESADSDSHQEPEIVVPPYEGPEPEIVVKSAADGKIISRFWATDFAIHHKLFGAFKGKKQVVGAAVIRQSELLKVIGHVPQPHEGQTQLSILLQKSRGAVDKPHLEFVTDNVVLKSLNELSRGKPPSLNPHVVLFVQGAAGRLEVLPLPDRGGRPQMVIPLAEFQTPKFLHDKLTGKPDIVGASVLSTWQAFEKKRFDGPPGKGKRDGKKGGPHGPGGDRDREHGGKRFGAPPPEKPVVIAAFGRTPLKMNLLATADTLQRLGVNLVPARR